MRFDPPEAFIKVVDELLLDPIYQKDQTFMAGMRELDRRACERGISFYEMVYTCTNEYQAGKRARDWLKEIQSERVVYNKETLKHIFCSI